ncbi:MAG: DNA polymerase IV [Chloroflexota bacterium]|nr:DNA polymerase IV [Chloroflexota bacterium]
MTGRARPSVLHVDLDAFFAAVEQRDRPELRGRPVIVGGGGPTDRGVVSAAAYEARRFGVRSAMPLRTAAALCPAGIFLPVDGRKYSAVSRQVMAILRRFTPRVEQVSIDEAFLDLAGSEPLFGTGESIAARIKLAIREELRLTASVGVATSKLVAKIASELNKPDGLVVVQPGQEAQFLAPLPIERLWGVGAHTRAALAEYGVGTIGDLAVLPEDVLTRRFGRQGALLRERASGFDPSPVADESDAKSVSHEHTFGVDTNDWETIERTLLALSEGVAGRLRAGRVKAATIGVKVRDADFETRTRQRTLAEPTDLTEPIWRTAVALARPQVRGIRVRLVGVVGSHLVQREQLSLFGSDDARRRQAVAAEDAIRRRFGERAITRARLLRSGVAAPFERDHNTAPEARRVGRPGGPGEGSGTERD